MLQNESSYRSQRGRILKSSNYPSNEINLVVRILFFFSSASPIFFRMNNFDFQDSRIPPPWGRCPRGKLADQTFPTSLGGANDSEDQTNSILKRMRERERERERERGTGRQIQTDKDRQGGKLKSRQIH